MSRTFEYNVFLSANQADKLPVRTLAERIRAAWQSIWFGERIIQPVYGIYLAMERGVETSHTLLPYLSLAALGSDWVWLESRTLLFRYPDNGGLHFT